MHFIFQLHLYNTKSMNTILKGINSRYKASKLLYRANKQIERANTLSLEIRANNVPHFLFRIFQQEKKYSVRNLLSNCMRRYFPNSL